MPLLRWLWSDVGPETLVLAQAAARKGAHVAEYAVLGWLTLRAVLLSSARSRPSNGVAAGVALAWVLVVAAADEAGQARSADRTGSPFDVGLDLAGGALGAGLRAGVARRVSRRPGRAREAAALRR